MPLDELDVEDLPELDVDDTGPDEEADLPLEELEGKKSPKKTTLAGHGLDVLKGAAKSVGRLGAGAEAYAPGNLLIQGGKFLASKLGADTKAVAPWVRAKENKRKIENALRLEEGDLESKNLAQTIGGVAPYLLAPQGAATSLPGLMTNAAIAGGGALLEGSDPAAAGASGAIGALLPAAVNKVARPFAGSVATKTLEAAKRLGIELPASAATNSALAQTLESAGAKMIGGGKIVGRAQKAGEKLSELGSDLSAGGTSEALEDVGKSMSGGLKKYVSGWRSAKNAAYEKANLKGISVTPQQTLDKIDSLLAEGSLEPGALSYLQRLRKSIAPEKGGTASPLLPGQSNLKPKDATKLLSQIRALQSKGESYLAEPWAAKNKALFRDLADSLGKDLDKGVEAVDPALLQNYQAAKDIYIKGAKVRESDWAKAIGKLSAKDQPDKIVSAVFKPSMSAADIPKIFDTLGPDASEGIRSAVQAKLVQQATRGGNFTPQSLTRAIKSFGEDKASAILSPEQMAKLRDVAEVAQGLGKANRITGGSQTAYLQYIHGLLGLGGIALPAAAKVAAVGAGYARGLGSKTGQKWLTTGLGGPTTGTLAGRAAGVGTATTMREEIERLRRQRGLRE